MESELERGMEALHRLVDEQRARCLWFLRSDYYPRSPAEGMRVLDAIQKNGDRAAFQAAARIRSWLSPSFKDESAGY